MRPRMGDERTGLGLAPRAGLAGRWRARLYDAVIVGLTAGWYRAVLERVPPGTHLLDVGIGTGAALLANADLVIRRDIRVSGVDIDRDYVARCETAIAQQALAGRIGVRTESIDDHAGGPYDAAYFSGSFMLLPDPAAALRHVATLLQPGAPVFFTQTFEHVRSPWLERIKPLLRWLTTIDFGRVTYKDEFRRAVAAGGLAIDSIDVLAGGPRRSAVLIRATAIPKEPRPIASGAD